VEFVTWKRWLCAECLQQRARYSDSKNSASRFRLSQRMPQKLNYAVLNPVLVSFGSDETTRRVIAAVQEDGTCWCGGTVWHGRAAMRISVSSWATTDEDVERSLGAIIRVAARENSRRS
jgi:hypothetical protein